MIPEHLSPPRTWLISFFLRARSLILSAIASFILIASVVWLACMLYGSFYYFYLGVHLKDFDLHFVFTPCELNESTRCSVLESRDIPSFREHVRDAEGYSVSLELRLPPSEVNMRHGSFMVCLSLGEERRCLGALPLYKSPYLRSLEATVLLPFYILGLFSEGEVQSVNLLFWEDFRFSDGDADPHVSVLSRTLDVYHGALRVHPKLGGLRYFMYHHYVLSTLLAVSGLSILIASLLCAVWVELLSGLLAYKVPTSSPREEQIANLQRRQMRGVDKEE